MRRARILVMLVIIIGLFVTVWWLGQILAERCLSVGLC